MERAPPTPLVAVVILNWNKATLTAACVAAVARMTYSRVLTLVVDNGSDPGSLGPIEALETPIELIRNPRNLGFTGGVNTGITRALAAGADYIWLLNNDALPDADTLSILVSAMQSDLRIGMASPIILNSDANDEVDFCGGLLVDTVGGLPVGTAIEATTDLATYERWARESPKRIFLFGTALLMRRSMVEAVGLYDDRFFAYWEDVDYSVRCLKSGFDNIVVPDAEVRHASGTLEADLSSKPPRYYYYMTRNELLFNRKHLGWWVGRRPIWWAVRRLLRRTQKMNGDPQIVDAFFLGLYDGLTFRRGAYDPARRLPRPLRRLLLAANRRLFPQR